MSLDPRVTPARPDLAAAHLEGVVAAPRYVAGRLMRVAAPIADLRRAPQGDVGLETQLLQGERFTVYAEDEGWAWGQAERDLYVGYAPAAALAPAGDWAPTHVVAAARSLVLPAPDLKFTPRAVLSLGARLRVAAEDARFARLDDGGFVPAMHLVPCEAREPDILRVAEQLLGTPYLWGGRTSDGLDCSALVQLALQRAGLEAPRDADQQEQVLGTDLGPDPATLRRGDLVFWEGHVGLMADSLRLIHANVFHMAVALEPFAVARARILAAGFAVKRVKRLG
jgi:Bacterial dipeptidyl-peptidase Sh3 domain/NlpC/P60 family